MPKALQIDHSLIGGLILQGFTPAEVSRKTGVAPKTIATWSRRFRWVERFGKPSEIKENAIEKQSVATRALLAAHILEDADAVNRVSDRDLPKLAARVKTRGDVIANAAKVFAWGDAASGATHVTLSRIDVHSSASDDASNVTQRSEIIDVSGERPVTIAPPASSVASATPISPSEYIAPSSEGSATPPSEADARGASADASNAS